MDFALLDSLMLLGGFLTALPVLAHCEVPCGIYDDDARFTLIAEDITTVEKAMGQIMELSTEGSKNHNQIVRWVTNKEKHAERIQETVYQYFMTQRVKPPEEKKGKEYEGYVEKISLLHEILIYAMKAKQGTDTGDVDRMKTLLADFRKAYTG
jgi:nickel superoxide dismutase